MLQLLLSLYLIVLGGYGVTGDGFDSFDFYPPTLKESVLSDHFPAISIVEVQRAQKMVQEKFSAYIATHSVQAMESANDLCSRKYIIGTYACPGQVGNRLHEMLNALVAGVITNRTLLWKYCNYGECQRNPLKVCDLFLRRAEWVPAATDILPRLAQCPGLDAEDVTKHLTQLVLLVPEHSTPERYLACADLSSINSSVINLGKLERREVWAVLSRGSRLGREALKVARLLFSLGSDYVYGLAFRSLFAFTDRVNEVNAPLEARYNHSSTAVIVGVHVRHMRDFNRGEDAQDTVTSCLYNHLNATLHRLHHHHNHSHHSNANANTTTSHSMGGCVVYVASDREVLIAKLRARLSHLGCNIETSPRPSLRIDDHTIASEHGVYGDSLYSMADLALLSTSHVLLGAAPDVNLLSTFSMLIAGMVATREYDHYHIHHSSSSSSSRDYFLVPHHRVLWLQSCLEWKREYSADYNLHMDDISTCD